MKLREQRPLVVTLFVVLLLTVAFGGLRTPAALAQGEHPPATGASAGAGGAEQGITFKRLTLDDGLSQSSIYCMVQDAQGFMWFGTEDGLNRYDGYEIRVFRHDPDDPHSLSDNYIVDCTRDQRDVIWVVTLDGTLHRYEPQTGRFVRHDLELEDPFQWRGGEFLVLHGDAQGRLWIGTYGDGLVRYDPEEDGFTYYRHDPNDPTSLSHRLVPSILEDHEGVIWLGTEAGLNRYDAESDSFVRYPYRDFPPGGYQYDPPVHDYDPAFQPDNPHALASPAASRLLEDREGRLWVGTRYGGLNRLDRESGEFTAYPYDPAFDPENSSTFSGNSVRQLLEDRFGHIWVRSADWNVDETRTYARLGLERLDPETDTITRYTADPEDPCGLPHDAVLHMFEDTRGTLWFHTFAGGLEVYNRETGCFAHYGHDPDDPQSLSGDGITGFYEDEGGGLWIGTDVSGANLYDPTWAKFASYRVTAPDSERLSNNSIRCFEVSPENLDSQGRARALWVSTYAGINYWDRRHNTFTFYEIDPLLPDNQAYAIVEDAKRDVLWLATSMGLERAALPADISVAPETLDFTRILTRSSAAVGFVLDLHTAGPDHMWVARNGVGLQRFDLATEEVSATYRHDPDDERSLGDDRVRRIVPGRDERLWVVTVSGVEHFDPATGVFTHTLHDPDGVAPRVLSLYEDATGAVWLGTQGGGLQRLDPVAGEVTTTYGELEGLANNVVYSILPDDEGRLWLSTNLGLSRFDPHTEIFEGYTAADGLQSNEFNYGAARRVPDGELFFGGVNGINAFYPQKIRPNPYVPPVVITEIELGPPRPPLGARLPGVAGAAMETAESREGELLLEAPPNVTEQIELSYRDRVVSFKYAALHYAIPERNQYAYMLDGFDPDWNHVGNRRFATYTNLPPGRYSFRVKATNSDGVWNEEGASLAVTVTPPFWVTWWFRGIVALTLVGGVFGAYRLRVRTIRARSRELEREVAGRTKELASLNAIAAVLSRSLDRDEMLADALEEILEVLDIEAGGIYLLDEDAGVLPLVVQCGFSPDFVAAIDRLRVGEGFSGRVVQSGEPLVVRDVSEDPRLTRMAVQEEGMHSLAVVPLSAKGKVLGTLFVVTRGYRTFSDRDVELLVSIGQQIGVAVENAGLYEDTRRRLAQLTALQETTTAVASTLELEKLLQLIVRNAVSLLQAEGGILNLVDWEAGEDEVVAADGVAEDWVGARNRLEGGLSGWVTLHDQAVVSNNVRVDERVDQSAAARLELEIGRQIRNTAAAPLRVKDRVVGTLVMVDKQVGEADFDQSDLNLLQALANQAATAIENARLFEGEQRRAEQFRVISEVGRRTTSILSIDQLLEEMVFLIQDSFEYDVVEIGLVEGEDLVFQAGVDRGLESSVRGHRLRVGEEGITGRVAATGEPLLVPDVSRNGRFVQFTDRGTETRSELAVPIKTREKIIGVLNVQSAHLDAFDESDMAVLQALADQAATAIENARLFEAEQRRAEQFCVISEVGRHITSILTVDDLLEEIVRLIRETFDYYLVTVGLIEGDQIVFKAGVKTGWPETQFLPPALTVGGRGITAWVADTGEPILAPDVSKEPRFLFLPDSSETQSELAVPLRTKSGVMGVLNVESDQPDAFDESDLVLLQSLANQAAIAIENARLYEQAQRLAVVEERQRLARELHDSVTQALYGTTLYAEAAARQLATGEVDLVSDHLEELRDTAQEALREMRLLIFELRPSILDSEGLVNALRARLEAVEERAGLEVELRVHGDRALPTAIEEGLYRIAQEALNNTLKHACARRVSVSLDRGERAVVLEVTDDGVGFDPSTAVEGGGLGLDGMIERAAKMSADLLLDSEPGAGTRVRVEVPQ